MIKGQENTAMANIILAGIKDYGFMHSSQFITYSLVAAVKYNLPSICDYLEASLKVVDHTFNFKTQRYLKASSSRWCP